MSSAIAIIDPYCLTPYTLGTLETGVLGGAESVVMRIARANSKSFRFHFYQNGRIDIDRDSCGFYRPIDAIRADDLKGVAAIAVISSWKSALKVRKLNPHCPIFLRLHANPGRHNRRMGAALAAANIEIVCVSQAHARYVRAFLSAENPVLPAISAIYNPVDDNLFPDDTPRNRDRLFFPGTPLKGISETLEKFALLRRERPELQLDVAESANLVWPDGRSPEGVNFLGRLDRGALVETMRRSLCIFYPQTRFDAPFGLQLAEANAVGTPVLADASLDINREILGTAGQCIDTGDTARIAARIDQWRIALPEIPVSPQLRLSRIAEAWRKKLTGESGPKIPPLERSGGMDAAAAASPSR